MSAPSPPSTPRPPAGWIQARRDAAKVQQRDECASHPRPNALLDAWVRFSSGVQAEALAAGGSSCCLHLLSLIDLAWYSSDRVGWTSRYRRLMGDSYAGLGKLNLSTYDSVARILTNEQQRGPRIGRVGVDPARFPSIFPLFLSNIPDLFPEDFDRRRRALQLFHATLTRGSTHHGYTSPRFIAKVQDFAKELHRAEAEPPRVATKFNGTVTVPFGGELIAPFVLWWVHFILLGIDLDLPKNEKLRKAARSIMDIKVGTYVRSRIAGLPGLLNRLKSSERGVNEELLLKAYTEVLANVAGDVVAETGDGRLAAETFLGIIAVAGNLGGVNLLAAGLAFLPKAASAVERHNEGDDSPLTAYILECARIFPPVNQINVLNTEPLSKTIGKNKQARELVFPPGTPIAANILGASYDPRYFPCPAEFDLNRPNTSMTINFATVGLANGTITPALDSNGCPYARDPARAAERACPGRFLAIDMVKEVLCAYYDIKRKKGGVPHP